MPRNLNAWIDIVIIHLAALLLLVVLFFYNCYIGTAALMVWLASLFFGYERCRYRSEEFAHYCHTVISNVNEASNYAIENLPHIIVLVDRDGRLQWFNKELEKHINKIPEYGMSVNQGDNAFWPELDLESIWGKNDETVFVHDNVHFKMKYRPIATKDDSCGMMALYIMDDSPYQILSRIHANSRSVLMFIQIDNYDDVLKGLNDAEKNRLSFEANKLIDEWIIHLDGYLRRIHNDMYIAVIERRSLDVAIAEKFSILDKMHNIFNTTSKLPVTLSMGISVADRQNYIELGQQAQSMLDLALSRGGDQAAIMMNNQTCFFGGKTKALEKQNRVKARVMASNIKALMQTADEIFIMGHQNEDFDALGAAMGVARMAKSLEKPVHIILSDMNEGIGKIIEMLSTREEYSELFISNDQLLNITAKNPLLFVVDTFIPHITAAPDMLNRVENIVVIDHHRRSENFIKNTKIAYLETATSSTSELVTELLMYFSEDLKLSRIEAIALYSGILVDTKNFAVQVGVRTFEAAAYLRRWGADLVAVRQLFRTDFDTEVAEAKAIAAATMFPNGLIITKCPDIMPNIQVVAAQVADAMLRIENVRVSLVIFQLTTNTVGVSARSNGEINVQLIMENFGGGGHQNVAGTQLKDGSVEDVYNQVLAYTQEFIEENDKNESNITEGH
ncbi:MAG: DHH family phosphoesterase [Anaerovibrio sp.]|uniref:DHH family phosphoesterase n=1 Tax=Anaerovibrio sp. TaxID=1872532 RepID=UPI0025C59E91|nr:DHH family phosphoesterase [Anaerovibrio sp.]MBE6098834.1 DHH family phosphoesterase [Anaerovibrio sp.]